MGTVTGTSTTQQSIGKATICTGSDTNFMIWTGLNYVINFATTKSGYSFKSSPSSVSFDSDYQPAFVMMPNGQQAYVIWADRKTSQIKFAVASTDGSNWTLATTATTIANSKAIAGPTALFGQQNGTLVINIVWQDSALNSLALAQIPALNAGAGPFAFTKLNQSCIDVPCLWTSGAFTFLCYFDATEPHAFNLVRSQAHTLTFDATPHFTEKSVTSSYGPEIATLIGGNLAYVFWSTTEGVRYAQFGLSATSGPQLNTTPDCSGIIPNTSPTGSPDAQLISVVIDGVTTSQLNVNWPDSKATPANTVYVTQLQPSFTPIPL